MRVICVIPARYSSSRFEGKPWPTSAGNHDPAGLREGPEVADRVRCVVATDDDRIFEAVGVSAAGS